MNEGMQENYFSKKISELRKMAGLTQEQLAEQMGITYQAVSKWENGIACPDIMLLPKLADVFKIQIDEFFREKDDVVNQREKLNIEMPKLDFELPKLDFQIPNLNIEIPNIGADAQNVIINELPWHEDGKIHVVVYQGHRLMKHAEGNVQEIIFKYEGAATEVISQLSVTCNDVSGSVTAGDNVNANHITGKVKADRVKCTQMNT